MVQKNSHCSFCGQSFDANQRWPRVCGACGNTAFLNPLPVAVILLPVDAGVLLVRRNIEPQIGQLALPGGYMNLGETWQQAGARELFEETGIIIRPAEVREFCVKSAPGGTTLLVFGLAPAMRSQDLPEFVPNEETQEMCLVTLPQDLAFSTHTEALREYFERRALSIG
jgi:ADP-ribose pyrophosphatase YjhB (NUDIX family)